MKKIIAIVGMPGAGKSTATAFFEEAGFRKIRFGDVTMEEIAERGLAVNEENESMVRETLRLELGMDAYAKLNEPKIKAIHGDVVIDGLYSWQEYEYLKLRFPGLRLLSIITSPKTRYLRLAVREVRPLTKEEAEARDYAELENLRKAEPIVMADYSIINEGSMEEFKKCVENLIRLLAK
ncbi:AAA family ATPase [Candidatus Woesearchaeota archaeon]|nr:AAA family ATPase [Candidatus Woesearchaeota archaeon]